MILNLWEYGAWRRRSDTTPGIAVIPGHDQCRRVYHSEGPCMTRISLNKNACEMTIKTRLCNEDIDDARPSLESPKQEAGYERPEGRSRTQFMHS